MDNELYHYGRKGMKWGQNIFGRRNSSGSGTKKSTTKSISSRISKANKQRKKAKAQEDKKKQEVKEANKIKKKKVSEMTDDELQSRINRLQMEKQYRDLEASLYPKKGENFISQALKDAAKGSVNNLAGQAFDTIGGEAINKIGEMIAGYDAKNPNTRIVNARKRQKQK